MRIAIVGAGIIGVTSAYQLACDGHDVTVYDRADGVASGASFANASVLSPALALDWAGPALPRPGSARWLDPLRGARPGPGSGRGRLGFAWRRWRSSGIDRGPLLLPLAQASVERLHQWQAQLRLDAEQAQGVLVLLRGQADLKRARAGLARLADLGLRVELTDRERAYAIEPGLNRDTALRAGVYLAGDGMLNCRQFAHALKAEAQRRGVVFHFRQPVHGLRPGGSPAVRLADGERAFDAVVVCAGHEAVRLLSPLGLRLPLLPVWGASLTAALREHADDLGSSPVGSVIDERQGITLTRLGRRMRVAGGFDLGGSSGGRRHVDALYRALDDWFPGAAQRSAVQQWTGARPCLPDGLPVIGPTGQAGIWLNLGHGASGWTLAAGSAQRLSNLIAGDDRPDQPGAGLDLARLL